MFRPDQDKLKQNIQKWTEKYGSGRDALLPILQEIQANHQYITEYAMQIVADVLDIHPVEVYGVVSFYSFLDDKPKGKFIIRLCSSISCDMQGKDNVARQLENDLGINFGQTTEDGLFTLEWVSCLGMCDQGPAMLVNEQVFTHVTPEKVHNILEGCRRAFASYKTQRIEEHIDDVIATNTNKTTFSTVKSGASLKSALDMSRVDIIRQISESGLRGRGGAGFPTSVKWNLAATARDDKKYVVCNADEGEPGTFKDRYILTKFADLVIEAMTIAGYAIQAQKGILYLRGEYTYLKKHLESVIDNRRTKGFLGSNIMGRRDFDFDVEIRMGAGAYICGEESALIESLEGRRGEPRNRPPFPVDTGFMGHPTVVNNVETFAWVCTIFDKGADWFRKNGTEKSTGLKLFSISGDCEKPGVYEYPMGITVNELLENVGGENAKAVQIGGASGHCVPREEFDRTIAYEDIATGGSIIVFGPDRDMLEVAENFLEFFVEESCGQCTPCREGNAKLLEGVRLLKEGRCPMNYLLQLCSLAETIQIASKCGLGQSSPNTFLSIVRHFKGEIMGRAEQILV